jgi:hypothetical protein
MDAATTGMPAIAGISSAVLTKEAKTPVKAGMSSKTENSGTSMTPATSEHQQDVSNKGVPARAGTSATV